MATKDILDIVQKRRSIRRYKHKPIPQEFIDKVLEAGRWAPSGLNNQPWRLMVIQDEFLKDGLAGFTKYGRVIKSAPVAICIFFDHGESYSRDKDLMAIGACIQNMCLEAYSQGLGTCWLGEILNQKDDVHRFLKTDSDLELAAVLTLGFPEEKSTSSRKSLKSILIVK